MSQQNIRLTLPDELMNPINSVIKNSGLGYESETEFFKEAAIICLRDLAEYNYVRKQRLLGNHR